MKLLTAGLCGLLLLSACAVYKDKEGQTHYEVLPPPPAVAYVPAPAPPPPPVYYAPAEPPVYYAPAPQPGIVIEGSGPGPDRDRARRVEGNCNTQWTGCSNGCNTIKDPGQRAVCVANCNHARDLCVRKNLGN